MNNLKKSAPYLYLTRATQQDAYMIFLLIPLDTSSNVNLSGVSPTDQGDHFQIAYTTSGSTLDTYRLMHWTITKGNKQYVKAVGNGNADLTMKLYFDAADTELATPAADHGLRHAPYIFLGTEIVDGVSYVRPSCIVLFDLLAGLQTDVVSFDGENCSYNLNCGLTGIFTTNPAAFVVNQNVRARMISQMPYFEATVIHDTGLTSPFGDGKKKRKVATKTPVLPVPVRGGGMDTMNGADGSAAPAHTTNGTATIDFTV